MTDDDVRDRDGSRADPGNRPRGAPNRRLKIPQLEVLQPENRRIPTVIL